MLKIMKMYNKQSAAKPTEWEGSETTWKLAIIFNNRN